MTDAATDADEADAKPKKGLGKPILLGLVLALLGGGGGFAGVWLGLIPGLGGGEAGQELAAQEGHGADDGHGASADDHGTAVASGPAAFVTLDPIVVNLSDSTAGNLLRLTVSLEVAPGHEGDVTAIKPRVVDVLNGFLRAVNVADLEDPTALIRLRGQMLHRVQVVEGGGNVRDLLILEFIIT